MARWKPDRWFLAVTLIGLLIWFTYCAVQPHAFWGTGHSRRTIFGWDAPGFSLNNEGVPPDRFWIARYGWILLAAVAGWRRPSQWLAIGVATIVPTWLIYIPTAPRDGDGMWGVGTIVLPFAVIPLAFIAWLAGRLGDRFRARRLLTQG